MERREVTMGLGKGVKGLGIRPERFLVFGISLNKTEPYTHVYFLY